MPDTKTTPKSVFVFPNGMIAVTGYDGQQIPELQGQDTPELRDAIKAVSDERTEWNERC